MKEKLQNRYNKKYKFSLDLFFLNYVYFLLFFILYFLYLTEIIKLNDNLIE